MSLNPGDEVKSRLRPFGIVFEKSLRDLIKGIRANKEPEAQAKFLQNAIAECRQEVKTSDLDLKTMAILKLCYLEMYGFDMSWANFNVLEVMASPKFQQKRVGYLAASQAFRNDDDILMLTTNLLKKDLNNSSSVDTGVALSGISSVVTPALARDISGDIIKMLNHSKPYIRKKAVLALYKVFLQYPEALRTSFDRLCEKLNDKDDSVMAATVTVICELAKKTPKNFVNLAPQLYEIFSTTKNNWVTIRLLKLFSSLAKIEPRLNARLIPRILEIITTTNAMSLIYECINCIVVGEMLDNSNLDVAQICVDNLKPFFTHADPNLQFVGLLTLNKIGKISPQMIFEQGEVIIGCLNHPDLSIRKQALELLEYVVYEENLEQSVSILMNELVPNDETSEKLILNDEFKILIINRTLDSCIANNYNNVSDFDWFVSVLTDLIKIAANYNLYEIGYRLGKEFRNVLVKVPSLRSSIINDYLIELIEDKSIIGNLLSCVSEIIWAIGEYSSFIQRPQKLLFELIDLFNNRQLLLINADNTSSEEEDYENIIIVLIPAIVKILNSYCNGNENYIWNHNEQLTILSQLNKIINFFEKLSVSKNFNIQERSTEFLEILKLLKQSIEETENDSLQPPLLLSKALPSLFNSWQLNPIGKDAQKNIPIPNDLNLDEEIYPIDEIYNDEDMYLNYRNPNYKINENDENDDEILSNSEDEFEEYSNPLLGTNDDGFYHDYGDINEEEKIEKRQLERLERQKDDPFYLSNETTSIRQKNIEEEVVEKPKKSSKPIKKKKKVKPVVLIEETLPSSSPSPSNSTTKIFETKKRKNILRVDSNGLENFDLNNINSNDYVVDQENEGYVIKPEEVKVVTKKKSTGDKKKKKKKKDDDKKIIEVKKKSKKKSPVVIN